MMRPAISTYVVSFLFIGILEVIFLMVYLKDPSTWQPLMFISLAAVFILYVIRSNKIEITNGKCTISKPFVKSSVFNVEDVTHLRIMPSLQNYKSKLKPPLMIEIAVCQDHECDRINFNAKLYKLNDIQSLSDICKVKLERFVEEVDKNITT